MKLSEALADMFPGSSPSWGGVEMAEYQAPVKCEILARGVDVANSQKGRLAEVFLVDYLGTAMFISTCDKWSEGGIAKAGASITRTECPELSREALTEWAHSMIDASSQAAVDRKQAVLAVRRTGTGRSA